MKNIEQRFSDAAKANSTKMPESAENNDELKSIFDFILEKDKRTMDLVNHQIATQEKYFSDKLSNLQITNPNNDNRIKFVTKPFQLSGKEDDYFIWYLSFMNNLEASKIAKKDWILALGLAVRESALIFYEALKNQNPGNL